MNELIETCRIPIILFFAVPIALAIGISGFIRRDRFRRGLFFLPVATRIAVATMLLFLLAQPEAIDETKRPANIDIVVDRSRSIGASARRRTLDEVRATIERLAAIGDPPPDLLIVAFHSEAKVIYAGPADRSPEAWARLESAIAEFDRSDDGRASVLDAAFAVLTERRGDTSVERHIWTDGAVDPPPFESAPVAKTTVFHAVGDSSNEPRRRITFLTGPDFSKVNEPFALKATIESNVAGTVELELLVDGEKKKDWSVELTSGSSDIEIRTEGIDLSPGLREVLVRLKTPDDEPLDDSFGTTVFVEPKKETLIAVGAGAEGDALLRALGAQNADTRKVDVADLRAFDPKKTTAIVLDRVAPGEIAGETTDRLIEYVKRGGGLFLLPKEDDGELLRWNEHPLAAILPLVGTVPPPPPPEEKKPEKDDPNAKKLEDPDIEKSRVEKIEAPTLAMLFLIDKSSSMGENGCLDFAKKGAIASARELHPDDKVGVIAFNQEATEIVSMQPAGDIAAIERAIQRLRAGGGTDIKKGLEFAKDVMSRESAAVKVVVLLSDGYTMRFNEGETAKDFKKNGIAIMTVGIGGNFDRASLSLLAFYSGGTGPIPARSAEEIPKVLVDVAGSVMKDKKTRTAADAKKKKEDDIHRPEEFLPEKNPTAAAPQKSTASDGGDSISLSVERFAVFLSGIDWQASPHLFGRHPATGKSGTWTSLVGGDDKKPVLAHAIVGDGVVAMATVPSEGRWSREFAMWDAYAVLFSQIVRFIGVDIRGPRFETFGVVDDRTVLLVPTDRYARDADENARGWEVRNADSGAPSFSIEKNELGAIAIKNPTPFPAPFLRLDFARGSGEERFEERASFFVPAPREVRERGVDLERLDAWRRVLGAETIASGSDFSVDAQPTRTVVRKTLVPMYAVYAVIAFALDFLLKRLLRRRPADLISAA